MKNKTHKIYDILSKTYPNVKTALTHKNPIELLIATILSAQCTDKKVNEVTPALFAKYKNVESFANAKLSDLEKLIKQTGFYKQKSKSVIGCCKTLIETYDGKIPKSIEGMIVLPGVGRKTASVVLGNAFGIPSIPVDTHVKRLSVRIGLSDNKDPEKIEMDLRKIFPEQQWIKLSLLLITHGRKICIARKPKCEECVISELCAKRI